MKKTESGNNKVVVYARYSSHAQNEQSIEGQLHDAYAYAEKNGLTIIHEYIDRAISGTKDTRPQFQQMIQDSALGEFSAVIVWKVDRFARNRYDSAIYKHELKKNGVRLLSIMESFGDGPEAIILESLMEAMAEYYSANLAENVKRGQRESVSKGWWPNGSTSIGYVYKDHRLVADPETAGTVREIYDRYAAGETICDILRSLNSRGARTAKGGKFSYTGIATILKNPVYIGKPLWGGQIVEGASDAIVSEAVFDKVQKIRAKNEKGPGAFKATVPYALQGKVFCGHCGEPMCGECGRSRGGDMYYYYACSGKKKHRTECKKKNHRKDELEKVVVEAVRSQLLDERVRDNMARLVVDLYNSEVDASAIDALEKRIRKINTEIDNLVDSLATCPAVARDRIYKRIEEMELARLDAETQLSKLRIAAGAQITEADVRAWLSISIEGSLDDIEYRRSIIDTYVRSVYVYDNKIVVFFNIGGDGGPDPLILPEETREHVEDLRVRMYDDGAHCVHINPNLLLFCKAVGFML